MRTLARLLSSVAAVAAASFGTGGAADAAAPGDAVELRAGADGWSEAARERLRAKAELQEMRLAFTKKGALELNVNPNVQPVDPVLQQGTNLFTKKALDPAVNPFTKKALEPMENLFTKKSLAPAENLFTKKALSDPALQLQPNPNLEGLLLPATPSTE